jgi:lipopolysaccharide/colanic/teichoic acid biosynthesis glycosyltransferase
VFFIARVAAFGLLLVSAPLCLAIAIGIRLSGRGPIFYIAHRAGLGGATFRLFKFRTMRVATAHQSRISSANDSRVFPIGAFLRKWKLDELPQLLNIARGEMAFVGPRPEDPSIVQEFYTSQDRETLNVLPGLTSPGTLYYLTHAEQTLDTLDPERSYVTGPLKTKLEIDRVYFAHRTPASDFRVIARTVAALLGR